MLPPRSYRAPLLPQLLLLLLLPPPPSTGSTLTAEAACTFEGGSCECVVQSGGSARSKTGNFSSPSYPRRYSNGTSCTYKFVGLPHERVQVRFRDFAVVGNPGRCQDYVDVFVKIDHPDHDIFEVPLHGRYCGHGLSAVPQLLMSWNRTLIIMFSSDDSMEDRGFHGSYTFIDGAPYRIGTPISSTTHCAFRLSSSTRSEGPLVTPYYPAMYTDNMECQYQFEGKPGERIKVTFDDFSLFHGGDHCPFDYVQIFDSEDSSDEQAEIAKYCGHQPRFSVYSSKQFLSIKFKTQSGRNLLPPAGGNGADASATGYALLRGFNASYAFSRDFVNLDFMSPSAVHVKGSECDVRVTSLNNPTGGTIESPYFADPYPLNVTCYYYLDGRNLGGNNFDKPSIEFISLDLPSSDPTCRHGAYLAAYLYGQDATVDSADKYICSNSRAGNEHSALTIVSYSHRLTLKFDTRLVDIAPTAAGTGFRAKFRFVTNDTALASQQSCQHVIKSSSKQGSFSFQPNRPGTTSSRQSAVGNHGRCTYEFQPSSDEYAIVHFDSFAMGFDYGASTSGCQGAKDRVDVSFTTAGKNATARPSPIGSHCGSRVPGPIATEWSSSSSSSWLHLAAQVSEPRSIGLGSGSSDWMGFTGSYSFVPIPRAPDRCGADHVDMSSGVISSPGYPAMPQPQSLIDCMWRVSATKPGWIIHLSALDMDMAGSSDAGCQTAVLKVYKGDSPTPDYELCGRDLDFPSTGIISTTGRIKLRYLVIPQPGSRAMGHHKGFKLLWQLHPGTSHGCTGHLCNVTRTCIQGQLVCNRQSDCGIGDNSDEEGCGNETDAHATGDTKLLNGDVLYIIIGVAAAVVAIIVAVLVVICLCIRRLQKKGDGKAAAAAAAVAAVPAAPTAAAPARSAGAHPTNGFSSAGLCLAGGCGRHTDAMMTSYPPPMSYPGGAAVGLPNAYLSLGRPYTRCPSTSSSSGGRTTTNSTWLSGRDVDNMACLTVL